MNAACFNRVVRSLIALCIAGWWGASVSHADIVIDPFTDGQWIEVSGLPIGPRSATDSMTGIAVLGGKRDLTVSRTSNNGAGVSADVNYSYPGAIAYSSGPSATGNALVTYDGMTSADLTQGGVNDRFVMGLTSDLGSAAVVTVYTDATHFSQASVPVPALPAGTFTNVDVLFASFTAAGPDGGASFANVSAITVFIDGSTEAVDVAINYFVATHPPIFFQPLSPGYWKNHPCAWPVDELTLGSQTYTKCQLLKIMRMPKRGDASLILAFQLIAAKLNILSGADPTEIDPLVGQGDALLAGYAGKLPYKVKSSTPIGQQMTGIASALSALWF